MGYSMIFDTKIVKLSDGRIIHFDLSGCNNDERGRDRGDFTAKIYTEDEFFDKADGYKEGSKSFKDNGGFDLKIQGKYASYYDYGEHLLRMFKRRLSWEEFISTRYTRFRVKRNEEIIDLTTKEDIIEAIENKEPMGIYIGRPRKK